jgi:predicted outer membrane lipoprotein
MFAFLKSACDRTTAGRRRRAWLLGLLLAGACLFAVSLLSCVVHFDDNARYECAEDSDCGGDGYQCFPSAAGGFCCKPTPEICDGKDNDCNGKTDDIEPTACYDGPPGTEGHGECKAGVRTCVNGITVCAGQVVPQIEQCNGRDDDCNGKTDEGCADAGPAAPPDASAPAADAGAALPDAKASTPDSGPVEPDASPEDASADVGQSSGPDAEADAGIATGLDAGAHDAAGPADA